VEESIFYAYSNKHHDGFVGHSYIGEWANLAALTTTSDLKNTYGQIKVHLEHSKTGIGTLLDVGCIIGVACNVFGGDIASKYIPSFSWGSKDGFTENRLNRVVEVARIVMERRKIKQTQIDRDLLEKVYKLTAEERKKRISSK